MKKFNFATEKTETVQEAVIDINNTSPMDFVGKLCVSKLKIPQASFPIAIVPPLQRTFTTDQKREIDAQGMIPTEFYFVVLIYSAANEAVLEGGQCNGQMALQGNASHRTQWRIKDTKRDNRLEAIILDDVEPAANNICYMKIFSYWYRETPNWKQVGDGEYQLSNTAKPIYSWNKDPNMALMQLTTYGTGMSVTSEKLVCEIEDAHNRFVINSTVYLPNSSDLFTIPVTTPVILLSDWLSNTNGLSSPETGEVKINYMKHGEWYEILSTMFCDQMTYPIHYAQVTYNPAFQQTIQTGVLSDALSDYLDLSANYNFYSFKQTDLLFPANHLAIQCLDLNYDGENMSINTKDINGVVVPSRMYFLKTFLISTNEELSDFIFMNDMTTANTVTVNSPNISRLQFRFVWIDSDQQVHPFLVWRNNVISMQLTLYPSEELFTKKTRL